MRPRPLRVLLFALACPAALFAARTAAAQETITFTFPNPQRVLPNASDHLVDHPAAPFGVSFDDCNKDLNLNFGARIDNITGSDYLQVWAGQVDCSDPANRPGGQNPQCWAVTPQFPQLFSSMTITIRAQDVAKHINGAVGLMTGYEMGTKDDCKNQTSSPAITENLYFLFFQAGGTVVGTGATYPLLIDLIGPPKPCVNGDVGIGDQRLVVHWLPPINPDVYGFRVFCDPHPGKETTGLPSYTAPMLNITAPCGVNQQGDASILPTGDGGTTTVDSGFVQPFRATADADVDGATDAMTPVDADMDTGVALDSSTPPTDSGGTDGGSTGTAGCSSSLLQDGQDSRYIPADYVCGSDVTGNSVTDSTQEGLKNDTTYTFAVAAIDKLGNSGPLTLIGCGTPGPIEDFWTVYRQEGGQAGGGFCSATTVESSSAPLGTSLVAIGAALGLAAIRRRKGRR